MSGSGNQTRTGRGNETDKPYLAGRIQPFIIGSTDPQKNGGSLPSLGTIRRVFLPAPTSQPTWKKGRPDAPDWSRLSRRTGGVARVRDREESPDRPPVHPHHHAGRPSACAILKELRLGDDTQPHHRGQPVVARVASPDRRTAITWGW